MKNYEKDNKGSIFKNDRNHPTKAGLVEKINLLKCIQLQMKNMFQEAKSNVLNVMIKTILQASQEAFLVIPIDILKSQVKEIGNPIFEKQDSILKSNNELIEEKMSYHRSCLTDIINKGDKFSELLGTIKDLFDKRKNISGQKKFKMKEDEREEDKREEDEREEEDDRLFVLPSKLNQRTDSISLENLNPSKESLQIAQAIWFNKYRKNLSNGAEPTFQNGLELLRSIELKKCKQKKSKIKQPKVEQKLEVAFKSESQKNCNLLEKDNFIEPNPTIITKNINLIVNVNLHLKSILKKPEPDSTINPIIKPNKKVQFAQEIYSPKRTIQFNIKKKQFDAKEADMLKTKEMECKMEEELKSKQLQDQARQILKSKKCGKPRKEKDKI